MTNSGPTLAIVVMGVAASGKTTVGRALAKRLGWRFLDADDYHSKTSRDKMHAGRPLTDRDRRPWLKRLHAALAEAVAAKRPVVLACSALTEQYRRLLIGTLSDVRLVYLRITPALARRRIGARKHFFNPGLLTNQFETLEEPADAITIDASWPIKDAVAEVAERLAVTR
jgi:carbohydrate kinase (thermoresistant glucokinase family)